MQIITRTVSVSVILAMVLMCLIPCLPTSLAAPTQTGEVKPNWDVNTYWVYRDDTTDYAPRDIFTLGYTDSSTPGGPYFVTAAMRLNALVQATQSIFTLASIIAGSSEYKLTLQNWTWDNGTWAIVVTDTGGDPGVNQGDTINKGTYRIKERCDGEMYMDMHNIDLKRGTSTCTSNLDAVGDLAWTEDITDQSTQMTSNGIDAVFKPDWDTKPIHVGDSWQQTNNLNVQKQIDATISGDIQGSDSKMTYTNYYWNFTWDVVSQGSKAISNTRSGTNTLDPALHIVRSGDYQWDYQDGTTSASGHVYGVPYDYWYACYGDKFDVGWFIELNSSARILYSSHQCFINTAPKFDSPPPLEVTIYCDKLWTFTNGADYSVSDPDPGLAGNLTYGLEKRLGTNTNVLKGLAIDPGTGNILFIPPQHDVAEGYTLTINVTDHYEKGALSAEASFILNVRNTNHAPTVNQSLAGPITMNEGDHYFPAWNLTRLFHDSDMDPNPLMGNQPYDPNDWLAYSADGLGSLILQCSDSHDFGPQHQCANIRFYAVDGKFPKDVILKVNLTATDTFALRAVASFNITIKHINHAPTVLGGFADLVTDVNVPITLDLQNYFYDMDVNNPLYLTDDALTFQTHSSPELTIQVNGLYAKIIPTVDWCGKGNVSFRATDKSGAYAEGGLIIITVQNCGPQFDIISWSPVTDPTLQEAGTSITPYPGQIVLSVKLNEKRGPLTYTWTVKDLTDGRVYLPGTNSSGFLFRTNYDEDFDHGVFFGNEVSRKYLVSVTVSDGRQAVPVRTWNVTVMNTDRPPKITGVDLYKVLDNGNLVKVAYSPVFSYELELGGLYLLDVSPYVSDADEGIGNGQGLQNLSRLTISWRSNENGISQNGAVLRVGAARTQSGYLHLRAGTDYVLTINVTDKEGAFAQLPVSLKVLVPEKTYSERTDYSLLFLVLVMLAIVIAIVYRLKRSGYKQ